MTTPNAEQLHRLLREFLADVRSHFQTVAANGEPEVIAERVVAALAATVGGVLLLMPPRLRRDAAAGALLSIAGRLWTHHKQQQERKGTQGPGSRAAAAADRPSIRP